MLGEKGRRRGYQLGCLVRIKKHSMSLAKYVLGIMGHVHWSSHYGTMVSWGLEFWFLALTNV